MTHLLSKDTNFLISVDKYGYLDFFPKNENFNEDKENSDMYLFGQLLKETDKSDIIGLQQEKRKKYNHDS